MKILFINGPNLNLLGKREPEFYGTVSLAEVQEKVTLIFNKHNWQTKCFQSNHEGKIIDFIQQNLDANGIIINPGGLTHNSFSLVDALTIKPIPFIEVHISNIHKRSVERHKSFFSSSSSGVIIGCGVFGYQLAAFYLIEKLANKKL